MTVPTENHLQTMDQAANSARTIRVAADGTFTIGQSSSVMLEGSISVEADSAYVSLKNAGISYKGEPQIQWTFKALKAGQTTVTVVVSGGIATFILRIPYNVVIS